jgi:hypothetical protein
VTSSSLLLYGSAWASLLAWTASEWAGSSAREGLARLAWSAGAALLVAHTALAFQLRHGWSHAAALRDTALQTEAVTGLDWGGGLYVNYAFAALWVVEAAWWWVAPLGFRRCSRLHRRLVRAFFLVMFANGAIVFARGPVRVIGTLAIVTVLWAWYRAPGAGEEQHA